MKVYVIGLGHIGLPMAAWTALAGKEVSGIDIDKSHLKAIENGSINIHEYYKGVPLSQIALNLLKEGRLTIDHKLKRNESQPAVFIITVGLGSKNGRPDLSGLLSVFEALIPQLIDGDLVLLRSTLIPGTCESLVIPKLKALNIQVHLAYCPETISETHAFEELQKNPMILAAMNDESYELSESFLQSLTDAPIYKASTIRTAEMAKVIQNITRDVNIALINEINEAANFLNVDLYELRYLANTHPRVKLLKPGPGVGGYCLPNALGYLEEALVGTEFKLPLMKTGRQVNQEKPQKIVELVKKVITEAGKSDPTIAVVGLAMKDYCADLRLSPALEIIALLEAAGYKVKAFDPNIAIQFPFQTDSLEQALKNSDCLLITAKQHGLDFKPELIINWLSDPAIVIDTRNTIQSHPKIRLYRV